jgi:hypothetical protein
VELRLRLSKTGFEAGSGQRVPVEARVLLDPEPPMIAAAIKAVMDSTA